MLCKHIYIAFSTYSTGQTSFGIIYISHLISLPFQKLENMNISVNGQSQVPPGFRFNPTEEELLQYYLRKKVSYEKIHLDVIRDVDLNKLEPWDIQESCKIGTTPQNDWYFFSHKDKKYPTGTRTNRATAAGFWKATGRDKNIYSNCRLIGMRKTLVFYKGRAPLGQKSDWIMHEYRLDENIVETTISNAMGEGTQEEGWVVCRIFKKKNHHKALDNPISSFLRSDTSDHMFGSFNGELEQILEHVPRNCNCNPDSFMKLPSLGSPYSTSSPNCYQPMMMDNEDWITNQVSGGDPNSVYSNDSRLKNWAELDQLVASQLNGQTETSRQLACFNDISLAYSNPSADHHRDLQLPAVRYNSEIDLWSFTRSSSSSDSLCHVVNASV